jgi:hypothetical protein
MQRFKLGFRNKSALEQLVICERTLANLAGKPEQQTDPQHLTDASATVAAVRASHGRIAQLRGELKSEITRRNQLLGTARNQVTRACLGTAVKVGFEPGKLMEAGLELEKPKTVPVGKPAAPDNFRGEPTDNEGEARLRWRRPLRRCTFEVEFRPDAVPDGWTRSDPCFRQTCLVKGLVSGVKYWFRVRAANAHGEGPWSNPVAVRVK